MAKLRSEKAGLPPGSLVLVGDQHAVPTSIRVAIYDAENLTELQHVAADRIEVGDPLRQVTWIDVEGLADLEAIRAIGERFSLHQLLLEDVLNMDHRPTIDEFPDQLFVVAKILGTDAEGNVTSNQASFVLAKGLVISFRSRPGNVLGPVRDRMRGGIGRLRKKGADYLLYSLLDVITDHYFSVVEDLGGRIAQMEERVAQRPHSNDLLAMQDLRRQLILVNRLVAPTREMAGRMSLMPTALIEKGTKRYINDLQDHTVYLSESINMFREQLTNLENTYYAGLNMRMAQVMKLLTVISTIFIPLTFIVGVYGMNFDHMPELHWRFGYYIVIAAMLLISGAMLWMFRRKGWL
ncbi:MAG: magnesium/cobalt transporter CorA [Bacteroidetes bacterium]|nr:magnesium/cobalt transporter CorA [Bacteroidota bacterium]